MTRTLSRWGLWALPAAGVLTGVLWLGALFAGASPDPSSDQAGFARFVTSPGWTIIGDVYIIGVLCLLFGVVALYAVLAESPARQWAAVGMILGVISMALLVGVWMILAFADPILGDLYQSGQQGAGEAFKVMSGGHWSGRMVPVFIVGGLAGLIAAISLGVAIWRSGRLPKWVGVAFGVAFLLSALSAPFVTLVGALLLVVTGVVIAREMGQLASA